MVLKIWGKANNPTVFLPLEDKREDDGTLVVPLDSISSVIEVTGPNDYRQTFLGIINRRSGEYCEHIGIQQMPMSHTNIQNEPRAPLNEVEGGGKSVGESILQALRRKHQVGPDAAGEYIKDDREIVQAQGTTIALHISEREKESRDDRYGIPRLNAEELMLTLQSAKTAGMTVKPFYVRSNSGDPVASQLAEAAPGLDFAAQN